MKFKALLVLLLISNLIINTNSVDAGFVFPTVFTYLANFIKLLLVLVFFYKIPKLKKIPRHFKYFICFEFFIFFYGLIFNSEYYQLKNTFLYFLPQIICLPIAFIYYNKISINIKFITRFSVIILFLCAIAGIPGLALQKTFGYLFILGIIHFLRSEHKYLILILLSYILLASFGLESRVTFIRLAIIILIIISYFFLKFKIFRKYSKKIMVLSAFVLLSFLVNLYLSTGKIVLTEIQTEGFNLTSDTRSLVYYNVISSTESTSEILLGRGASAKYKSHFYNAGGSVDQYRYRSEVDILNKYLYGGVFYVFMFFLAVFYKKDVKRKIREKEIIAVFLVLFTLMSFVENTSEYSTLWLLFWFLVLNYKYDRLHSINTHT